MTLRNRNRGLKSALTVKKRKLESTRRTRFERLSAKEIAANLAHCIKTGQMIWTNELFQLVLDDAKKQGLRP